MKTDLPGPYQAAVDTIKDLIDNGESILLAKDLPEGPGSAVGLERFAREYCKVNLAADLGMIYPILAVSTCIAAQGGYVLTVPISEGGWLEIPAIQMWLGIAPSGFGKSTALKVGMKPLTQALRAGISQRREILPGMMEDAKNQFQATNQDDSLVPNDEQFKAVYNDGLCPDTITQDTTQEGLRNQLVNNGGHSGIMAGEPDVFRNSYSSDSINLTFFLNGWDQADIDTTRVSNSNLKMTEASLSLCVFFQTEVFAEVTSGSMRSMGSGADSFTARGVFGRMFVTDTDKVSDYQAIANSYADDKDFDNDHADPDGYRTAEGDITPLGAAAMDFAIALGQLVEDTNQYRIDKAVARAWTMASMKYGIDLQVPEPPTPGRKIIRLDSDGLLAYRRVQRMMSDIQKHLVDCDDPDNKSLWDPMAARITQHVLREALTMSLAAGRDYVSAEFVQDAACRILPWRWCLSAAALTRRAMERAEDIMAESVITLNPQQRDLTPYAMISDILQLLAKEDKTLINPGLTFPKLRDKVRSRLPRNSRNAVSTLLKDGLQNLCADPASGVCKVEGPKNAAGIAAEHYTVRTTVRL